MYVHIYINYTAVYYLYGTIMVTLFQIDADWLISSKNSRKIIIKILDAIFKLLDYQYSTNIIFIIFIVPGIQVRLFMLCYYCLHSEKTTLNVWIPGFCFNISSGISLLSIKSINAS